MRTKQEFLDELGTWQGTPYAHGVSIKGQGVDCVRFVVSMSEWLHGRESMAECIPFNYPPFAAYMAPFPAMNLFKWMTDRYPCDNIYRKSKGPTLPEFMAGDVIVLENRDDGPVHMMMAEYNGRIWHSNNWLHGGVVTWTGMTHLMRDSVWCAWRFDAAKGLQ